MAANGRVCAICQSSHPRGSEAHKSCRDVYRRRWRAAHPGIDRGYGLKSRYGLSVEQYEMMFKEQGGVCFLCKAPPQKNRLHVDHNHRTGAIRKLLCIRCNTFLGKVEDPEFMEKVCSYLDGN